MSVAVKELVVVNETGIHARPSSVLVNKAAEFEAALSIENLETGVVVNAKSVIDIISNLLAGKGTRLIVRGEGPDAALAVEAIALLIESGFEER